jgi:uncharacterized membrane protein YkvA (DUF1232 family)
MSSENPSSRERQFYHKLRRTVRIWAGGEKSRGARYADFILAGPDLFMLLVRLAGDDRLSRLDRTKLQGAAAYFINPLDLVPELLLGPPGLVDDVALAALVLHDVLEHVDPAIVRQHWEGSIDVLELIRSILAVADTMLGGAVWRRLAAMAEGFIPNR